MANGAARSAAATIIGWVLMIAIVFLLFGAIIGTLRVLVRFAAILVVLFVLAWAYFRLKGGDDDD